MRSYLLCMLSGVLFLSFSPARAQDHRAHTMSQHEVIQTWHTQGTIRKASTDSLTIAHQAIPALNWPPMTMQFAIPKGSSLPAVHVGDKVSFSFVQGEEGYEIVSLTAVE